MNPICWKSSQRTNIKDNVTVSLSLIKVTLNSTIQKLPFKLPAVPITTGLALLFALGLGAALATPLIRAFQAIIEITPENYKFLVFYSLFALWFFLPVSMMFPTIAPTEGRLHFLARLPLPQRILGFCLLSPVLLVLVLLLLMIVPAYVVVSVTILQLSFINTLLTLFVLAFVSLMHAQLIYALSSTLAVRYNMGLSITTVNQILAFIYTALFVFAIRQSFLGVYSSYSELINVLLLVLKWPLMVVPATTYSQWLPVIAGSILVVVGGLFVAALPYVLAPRLNEGFGINGRLASRFLSRFPHLEIFLRFIRAPRMREHINVFTFAVTIITVITLITDQSFRHALSTQLIFLVASIVGNISALCSSINTPALESYQFQVGLSVRKMRAITFIFGLIFSIGYGVGVGAIVLIVLNQPLYMLFRLLVTSVISSLVGYAYGVLALSKSYYRTPIDGLALIACSISLLVIAALAEKVGYPLDSLLGGAIFGGGLLVAVIVVFVSHTKWANANTDSVSGG